MGAVRFGKLSLILVFISFLLHLQAESQTVVTPNNSASSRPLKVWAGNYPPYIINRGSHTVGSNITAIKKFAKKHNLKLEFDRNVPPLAEALEMQKTNPIWDIFPAIIGNQSDYPYLVFSHKSIMIPLGVFTQTNNRLNALIDLVDKKVGIFNTGRWEVAMRKEYSRTDIIKYNNLSKALADLKTNKIYALITPPAEADYEISHSHQNIIINFFLPFPSESLYAAISLNQKELYENFQDQFYIDRSLLPESFQTCLNTENNHLQIINQLALSIRIGLIIVTVTGFILLLLWNRRMKKEIYRGKKITQALRENRKRYRLLLETLNDAVLLIDIEKKRIVDCNPAACQLYGYQRKELTRLTPEQISAEPGKTIQNINNGVHKVDRIKHIKKDGSIFYVNSSNNSIQINDRDYLVSVIRDISDTVESERNLISREEGLKTTLNSIGDAVIATDTEDFITRMNPVAETLTGWKFTEALNKPVDQVLTLINAQTRDPISSMSRTVFKIKKVISITSEISLISRKGHEYRINYSISPILNKKHNCIGAVMVIKDITSDYEREQELKLWSERLGIAANVARFGIWEYIFPPRKRPGIIVNENWRMLYGYENTSVPIQEFWENGIHPEDRDKTLAALNNAISGRHLEFEAEFRFISQFGKEKWIYTLGRIVEYNEQGKPKRMVGIHQDITNRKHTEELLIKARQQAETANQAKSQFLATMSHEIRTPMNGVLGFIELLRETSLDESQKKYLDAASKSCHAMLALLNDILDFSRIEAGRLQLRPEHFNPEEFLKQLESTISTLLGEKDIELNFITPANLPRWVLGDPIRLRQILFNLLSNAIKFTEQGFVTLVTTVKTTGTTAHFEFAVKDTGIGINSEDLKMIFERFNQLDNSLIRKFGGTGLGLTICDELAKLMDGSISVDSQIGTGSVFLFRVSMPIVEMSKKTPIELNTEKPVFNGKVLVVEDDRINMMVIRQQLIKYGCEVETVQDGENAVNTLATEKFDLVVMDCKIPVMDGYEVTAVIRSGHEINRETPIIALTADAFPETRQRCLDAGMNDYMTKPLQVNQLLEILHNFLPRA